MKKVIICDECNHINKGLVNNRLKDVCEMCGYEINSNDKALRLFGDMSEKMVAFYMLSGLSGYKAKKRVYDILKLTYPPKWISFIKIRFDL